ncbi:MAG TPA: FAD-dependent oxidoreductase [Pyrinomonadaceae bacterium]|nr:FAD-dependent oxidoreductase [Pyrinomonadaceae bacterium]
MPGMTYDVAVIGAGVFGAWTAYTLRLAGASVLLIDAYGPGNSRASSGGESRMIRLGYGPDEIYSRYSQQSLVRWQQLFEKTDNQFRKTGILWLAGEHDPYCEATLATLQRLNANYEELDHDELVLRFPQLNPGPISWGILEPDSGVLMARRAVQAVVAQARAEGVDYLEAAIAPPTIANGKLNSVDTVSGKRIDAERFVFACGPWLPKLFPELLGELIHVTRQEVFFFGVPSGDESFNQGVLPAWIDFNDLVYGLPNLDGRGFKLAIDAHGPEFDPDTGERVITPAGLNAAREYLARRVPRLANAPVTETRVCQYENTSNGDFLIDRHPGFENVWLIGGGSGHGFKHGPAVGEYASRMVLEGETIEKRFSLETKQRVQKRKVY